MAATDFTFYYYPSSTGGVEKLVGTGNTSEGVSKIETGYYRNRTEKRTAYNSPVFTPGSGGLRVLISIETFNTANNLDEKVYNLNAHLSRGGAFGFALQSGKAWAAFRTGLTARGATSLPTYGNEFSAWEASAVLAAADQIVIESANPEFNHERNRVSSVSGNTITASTGLTYAYTSGFAHWVRHRDFYPALYVPQDILDRYNGQPLQLTSFYRLHYTLQIEAELDMAILSAGHSDTGFGSGVGANVLNLRGTSESVMQNTLDSVLGRDFKVWDKYNLNRYVNSLNIPRGTRF
jgi:hypothetical protein